MVTTLTKPDEQLVEELPAITATDLEPMLVAAEAVFEPISRPGLTARFLETLRAWLRARLSGPVAPTDEAAWNKLLARIETKQEMARVHRDTDIAMCGLNSDPFTGRIS